MKNDSPAFESCIGQSTKRSVLTAWSGLLLAIAGGPACGPGEGPAPRVALLQSTPVVVRTPERVAVAVASEPRALSAINGGAAVGTPAGLFSGSLTQDGALAPVAVVSAEG